MTDLLTEEEALTRVAVVPTFSRDSRYSDIVDDIRDGDGNNQSYISVGRNQTTSRARGKVSTGRNGGESRGQFSRNNIVEEIEGGEYNSDDDMSA